MNRRSAIVALAAAVPGLALAADKNIFLPEPNAFAGAMPEDTLLPNLATSGDVALKYTKARTACRFAPDGCIEIPLDDWTGWRVTYAGESIDITPAEIMAALRAAPDDEREPR